MNRELIENEIQLADDECCIVFDFGCYFPYSNVEILTFGFSLGIVEFDDYKINHRYPNKNYQTISKKYGRKISKLGYPYIMKLDEQKDQIPMLLRLRIGLKKQVLNLVFPLLTDMTKDKPICGLSLHYDFDKSEFHFTSHEKAKDVGWYCHNWYSCKVESNRKCDNDIILNPPQSIGDDSNMIVYDDIIKPYSLPLLDLCL